MGSFGPLYQCNRKCGSVTIGGFPGGFLLRPPKRKHPRKMTDPRPPWCTDVYAALFGDFSMQTNNAQRGLIDGLPSLEQNKLAQDNHASKRNPFIRTHSTCQTNGRSSDPVRCVHCRYLLWACEQRTVAPRPDWKGQNSRPVTEKKRRKVPTRILAGQMVVTSSGLV